jgi:fumarate hydratase subunit beta
LRAVNFARARRNGPKNAEACKKFGAVYTIFTVRAGLLAAKAVEEVEKVEWLDLGVAALWVMQVKVFRPISVVIDSEGENLYDNLKK